MDDYAACLRVDPKMTVALLKRGIYYFNIGFVEIVFNYMVIYTS